MTNQTAARTDEIKQIVESLPNHPPCERCSCWYPSGPCECVAWEYYLEDRGRDDPHHFHVFWFWTDAPGTAAIEVALNLYTEREITDHETKIFIRQRGVEEWTGVEVFVDVGTIGGHVVSENGKVVRRTVDEMAEEDASLIPRMTDAERERAEQLDAYLDPKYEQISRLVGSDRAYELTCHMDQMIYHERFGRSADVEEKYYRHKAAELIMFLETPKTFDDDDISEIVDLIPDDLRLVLAMFGQKAMQLESIDAELAVEFGKEHH